MSLAPILDSNSKIFSAQALTSSFVSSPIDVSEIKTAAVHMIAAGTPTGSITIEGGNVNDPTKAVVLFTIALTGAPKIALQPLADIGFTFLFVRYTFSSSTGTLDTYVATKKA